MRTPDARYVCARILGCGIAALAYSSSAAASADEVRMTPSQANPNNITYQESLGCLSRVWRHNQVRGARASVAAIRRGSSGTRGPITIASKLRLDNVCVINSPSVASRLHPAGQRSVTSTLRIKRRGAQKYGEWVLVGGPHAVGPPLFMDVDPAGRPADPGLATHAVRLGASADGLTSTADITSRLLLPPWVSRLRAGDRVQSGVILYYWGLILYFAGFDSIDPTYPVYNQVGGPEIVAGTSVTVKSQKHGS